MGAPAASNITFPHRHDAARCSILRGPFAVIGCLHDSKPHHVASRSAKFDGPGGLPSSILRNEAGGNNIKRWTAINSDDRFTA